MSIEELVCPKCGGPIPAEAAGSTTTCRFCAATVVPKMFDPDAATGPRCPRCTKELFAVRSGAKVVSVCERCGGVWVDTDTADYLTRVSDPALETEVRRAIGVVVSVSPAARQASVLCPVCEGETTRTEIAGTVNCIDRCAEHGTWFDRDELEMFVKAQTDTRAGDVRPADIPMEQGFFSRIFRAFGA